MIRSDKPRVTAHDVKHYGLYYVIMYLHHADRPVHTHIYMFDIHTYDN